MVKIEVFNIKEAEKCGILNDILDVLRTANIAVLYKHPNAKHKRIVTNGYYFISRDIADMQDKLDLLEQDIATATYLFNYANALSSFIKDTSTNIEYTVKKFGMTLPYLVSNIKTIKNLLDKNVYDHELTYYVDFTHVVFPLEFINPGNSSAGDILHTLWLLPDINNLMETHIAISRGCNKNVDRKILTYNEEGKSIYW